MDSLWLDLINSDRHDYLGRGRHEDGLHDPGWVGRLLARWDLPPRVVAAGTTRNALRELRALLTRLVDAIVSGNSLRETDIEALNGYLAAEPLLGLLERVRDTPEGYRMRLDPVRRTLRTALTEITRSFADVLVEGDLTRIRLCDNADCRWVFYDRSRSRTRRWCEGPTGCGNLLKVRRFRERRKNATTNKAPSDPRRKKRRR